MKELQNIFKTNLNDISKERFKSEEQQKSALENTKLLYKSHQAVINLFNILQLHLKRNTKQNM